MRAWYDGAQRARAAAHRAAPLGVGADHEARLVDEVHDRQAERVAQVDEARELVGRVRRQAAAVVLGVGREHADRAPVEAARARVISGGPKRRPISKTDPRSSTSSTMRRMSYGCAASRGTIAAQLLLAALGESPLDAAIGGASHTLPGR